MTLEKIERIKALIEDRLRAIECSTAALRSELQETSEKLPTILQNPLDHAKLEGDLGTRIDIHELSFKARGRLQEALNRITQGIYGRCMECGGFIGGRRLEVQPEAHLCIDCQGVHEKRPVVRRSMSAFLPFRSWGPGEEAA